MKALYFLFSIALLLCYKISFAQINNCSTDEVHRHLMQTNPSYKKAVELQDVKWMQYNLEKSAGLHNRVLDEDSVYEIPVVFHIIHTGQAVGSIYNPSDASINSLITDLNKIFEATYYRSSSNNTIGSVKIPIKFTLAKRTPSCQSTNGINRIDGSSVPNYLQNGLAYPGGSFPGATETAVKALSIWPSDSYMNIWLVTQIQGAGGYAYLPPAPENLDGVVIGANDIWEGILAHEVGHSLGLYHTFEGGCINNNCSSDGDKVCDTDPISSATGCNSTGINPCSNQTYGNASRNFLNYSGSCWGIFTEGQKDRMLHILENYRSTLTTSFGVFEPDVNPITPVDPPILSCIPIGSTEPLNYYAGPSTVKLADLLVNNKGYSEDGYRSYIDHTLPNCLQPQPIANLTLNHTYTIMVTTGDIDPNNVRGWIDFDNDGVFESSEIIISSNGTTGNQTHTATFTVPPSSIAYQSLRMRIGANTIYNFATPPQPCAIMQGNPPIPGYGQLEDFIVTVHTQIVPLTLLDFNGRWINKNNTLLSWKTENEINTLDFIVEKSFDGISFSNIGTVNAKNIAGVNNYSFTDYHIVQPTAKILYYRLKQRDIDGRFKHSGIVMLKINNSESSIQLYPNPVQNKLNIHFEQIPTLNARYRITDISGRLLLQGTFSPSAYVTGVSVSTLKAGYYFIEVETNGKKQQATFIKQ